MTCFTGLFVIVAAWNGPLLPGSSVGTQAVVDTAELERRLRTEQKMLSVFTEIANLKQISPLEFLTKAWSGLDAYRRRTIVYMASEDHYPFEPGVLALGVNDPDLIVQNATLSTLDRLSILPLVDDYRTALAWVKENRALPWAQVQAAEDRRLLDRILHADGAELDEIAIRAESHYRDTPSFVAPKWPRAERKAAFLRLFGKYRDRSVNPRMRAVYRDAAMSIAVDEKDVESVIAPLWYKSGDTLLCSAITKLVASCDADWARRELRAEYVHCVRHPRDELKPDGILALNPYIGGVEDPAVVPFAIHTIETGPPSSAAGVGAELLCDDKTGLPYDRRRDRAWWSAWWKRNKVRYAAARVEHSDLEWDLRSEKQVRELAKLSGNEVLRRCKDLWASLARAGKHALVSQETYRPHSNVVALLEIPLHDPDPFVQSYALRGLSLLSLACMSEDYGNAVAWAAAHRDAPLDSLRAEGAKAALDRYMRLSPSEAIAQIAYERDLWGQAWVAKSWSREDADRLFAHLIKVFDRGEDVPDMGAGPGEFIKSLKPDPRLIRSFAQPALEHPERADAYDLAVALAAPLKEDWVAPILVRQLRSAADDPWGPVGRRMGAIASALRMRWESGAGREDVDRFVPEMIRAVMLGSIDWVNWLGDWSLSGLVDAPRSSVHDRIWWGDWWAKNKGRFPDWARFAMPPVPAQEVKVAKLRNVPEFKEGEPFESVASKYVDYVGRRGVSEDDYAKVADGLVKADPVRAIPYLLSTVIAADDPGGKIGYGQLGPAVGCCAYNHMDPDWWRNWWARNRSRFPSLPEGLPKIDVYRPAEAPRSPLLDEVRSVSAKIDSISPQDDDYRDLEPLRKAIGNSRIVQLGEQSHGDGATFMAKFRIVRFLHEKCGFDVMLWESGMYDCDRMDEALAAGRSGPQASMLGVFPIWTYSPIVQDLFVYAGPARRSRRPLRMGGFDPQFSGKAAKNFDLYVESFFEKAGAPLSAAETDALTKATQMLGSGGTQVSPDAAKSLFRTLSAKILDDRNRFVESRGEEATDRTVRYLGNASVLADLMATSGNMKYVNVRDKRMAENLVWLANGPLKGKKIIVWAASFHLMHNAPQIDTMSPTLDYSNTVDMGQGVHEALGSQVYTIAFLAHRGSEGNPFHAAFVLDQAPPDSIEEALHQTGLHYAFVDMRGLRADSPLRNRLVAGPLAYTPMKAKWPDVFDGFFYTDVMFPSDTQRIPGYAK